MNIRLQRTLVTMALVWSLGVLPTAMIAQQTQIVAPKNKYKTSDDIKLGNQAANEAERMYPVIEDDSFRAT